MQGQVFLLHRPAPARTGRITLLPRPASASPAPIASACHTLFQGTHSVLVSTTRPQLHAHARMFLQPCPAPVRAAYVTACPAPACNLRRLPRPGPTPAGNDRNGGRECASTGRPPHPRRTQVRMCVATGIGGGPEPCPGRGTITPRSSQKGDGDQSSAEQSGLALTANRERQAVIGSRSEALPLSRTLAGALDHTQEREQ